MTITSPHNEKLKEIRKLNQRRRARQAEQRFVAEGEDLLEAAAVAGWQPLERYAALGSGLPGTPVDPHALDQVSELGSGTRTLAVFEERWVDRAQGPLVVYLHGIGDPGNVGAILRSAEAFGVTTVALGPGTADPYGPKAVRASMGAIFSVPVARCQAASLPGTTVALDAGALTDIADLPALPEVTLMVGAERTGLPEDLIQSADHAARIPIRSHSLNAAMATTVALYELTRMAAR